MTGVFGSTFALPSCGDCCFLSFLMAAPVVIVGMAVRSLLTAEPLPRVTLGLMVLTTPALVYFLWPMDIRPGHPVTWTLWRIEAAAVAAAVPIALLREGVKRGWFRR